MEDCSFPGNHPPWEDNSAPRTTVGAAISRPPMGWTHDSFSAASAHPPLSFYGAKVEESIRAISIHYPLVEVDKYCLMPDHIHLILFLNAEEPAHFVPDKDGRLIAAPTDAEISADESSVFSAQPQKPTPTISNIIGQMKHWVSKACGLAIWQKSFYDRVIRNEKEYQAIWRYIDENPLKWLENREER